MRNTSRVNRVLMIFLVSCTGFSVAQAQTAQDILKSIETAQTKAKDISFRLVGSVNVEKESQKFDLLIKSIPDQNLARLQFMAPDAFADNIVVADAKEVRQYMFLTNQITVTPVKKAAADAGIIGMDFTQFGNTSKMLSQFDVKLLGKEVVGGINIFKLEAKPKDSKGDKSLIWISEKGWRPTRIQVIDQKGKTLANLRLQNFKTNSGLTSTKLKKLPKSARVIKQ